MNFFKSVFADDPDPSNPEPESDPNPKPQQPSQSDPSQSAWNFGDLIKTIATKSETVIETYRRDLQEFGSGLKKEIEVAQGSLETVGTVIDDFGNTVIKSTAQIISQGTDAILADDHESDSSDSNNNNNSRGPTRSLSSNNKYSRFDAQVRAVQGDVSTYVEEPEDSEEYGKWKGEFVLEEKREEIEGLLLEENGVMESVYRRVVPSSVDHETFWLRYFFRVYKLKQAENVRAKLVRRAISVEDEEELSWDVDDDDDDDDEGVVKMDVGEAVRSGNDAGEKSSTNVVAAEEANAAAKSEDAEAKAVKEESPAEKLQSNVVNEEEKSAKIDTEKKGSVVEVSGDRGSEKKDLPAKLDEKAAPVVEVKEEAPASSKGSEDSGVASQASVAPEEEEEEEEDLGWDEIEDLSSIEEKKVNPGASGGSANRAELQKRLSTAQEEEEDLSWDIEDDDEPSKA